MSSGTVRLLSDGGAACAAEDFFRDPAFLRVEGTTHSLIVDGDLGRISIPLIVRRIDDELRDAISPYGYPGGSVEGSLMFWQDLDLSSSGLVSLFIRDRVGRPTFAGGTQRSTLHVYDPAKGRQLGATFMKHVRRNERGGHVTRVLAGSDVDDRTLNDFRAAYLETMQRAGAAESYSFSTRYLRTCLSSGEAWLIENRTHDGELAAAAIAVRSDGLLHYFLEGTRDRFRDLSPGKSCVFRALAMADDAAVVLNFGGGFTAGDGISRYKQTFCNDTRTFVTHEIIVDAPAYRKLSGGRDAGSFFPAYRATRSRETVTEEPAIGEPSS